MRPKKTVALEDLSERECLLHESERKAKAGKATLNMLARKIILKMQAGQ